MARKVLGQVAPAAATDEDLYTVPADTETVVSSLVVCNRGAEVGIWRMAVRPGGDTLDDEHYNYFDLPLIYSDTFIATVGITLAEGDVMTIWASTADFSFSLYGSEQSTL